MMILRCISLGCKADLRYKAHDSFVPQQLIRPAVDAHITTCGPIGGLPSQSRHERCLACKMHCTLEHLVLHRMPCLAKADMSDVLPARCTGHFSIWCYTGCFSQPKQTGVISCPARSTTGLAYRPAFPSLLIVPKTLLCPRCTEQRVSLQLRCILGMG